MCVFRIGPSLNIDSVMVELKAVKDKWLPLAEKLFIPRRLMVSHLKSLEDVIEYFLKLDPDCSWRSIIRALDDMEEENVVTKIQDYAEPLTGFCKLDLNTTLKVLTCVYEDNPL